MNFTIIIGKGQRVLTGDNILKGEPPHLPYPIDKGCRDIKGKRAFAAFQYRQGVDQIVAISVIKGENDEFFRGLRRFDALYRLVKLDDFQPQLPDP